MRNDPHLILATVSDRRSNEFHRVLTKWHAGDHDKSTRRTCAILAKAYRTALETQIEYLETTLSSSDTMLALQHARSLKIILEKDLELMKVH
jgi:hypothetical protein